MVSGLFDTLRKLPNPAEATMLLKEVNALVDHLTKIPPERIKQVTNLLDDVIELQRQNPGNVEPLKMAVQLICEINKCDMEKIVEIRQIMKEAQKLPLKDIIGETG
jgi:hypothetical protein